MTHNIICCCAKTVLNVDKKNDEPFYETIGHVSTPNSKATRPAEYFRSGARSNGDLGTPLPRKGLEQWLEGVENRRMVFLLKETTKFSSNPYDRNI